MPLKPRPPKPKPLRASAQGRTAVQEVFGFQDRMLLERVLARLSYAPSTDELARVPVKALIACTARSGSSLMAAALDRYGLAFEEYFNPEGYVRRTADALGGPDVNAFARRLRDDAVRGGVLAVKSSPMAILYLAALGEAPDRLQDWRVIFLRRRNAVRQGISGYIAERSGSWTSSMAGARAVTDDDYSFERILALIDIYGANNERWERFFGLFGIEPLRIFYEDYVADLVGGTGRIARFIGVDVDAWPDAHAHRPQLERQSTELNAAWEARFRADVRSRAASAVADAVRRSAG